MVNERFKQWIEQVGITKAADLLNDFETNRGNRGITYQSIQDWFRNGIPLRRITAVEAVSGISRHDLDPETFGPKATSESAA